MSWTCIHGVHMTKACAQCAAKHPIWRMGRPEDIGRKLEHPIVLVMPEEPK